MNNFLTKYENSLEQLATLLTPAGSSYRALVHQWIHAISSGRSLACLGNGITENDIISKLVEDGLFSSSEKLKEEIFNHTNFPPHEKSEFSFIDLFSGIGGFRLALQSLHGECVFSSEWDKSAQNTYFNNYGELPFGDITSFTSDQVSDEELDKFIPDHDVLAAGFPCQPFSHAGVSARTAVGKQHGFKCETQGTLFFDVMRVASTKRPKVLFLENVRNIERHDKGKTFSVIKKSIEEIGYTFKHQIIDASPLVPQRRVRCYMVCFRNDLDVDFDFPIFSGEPRKLKEILEQDVEEKYTISDKLWSGHINRTERNINRGTGFTAFVADIDKPSNTLVARYGKDGKECLIPQKDKNPRMLTPRECARLQGYPEDFIIPASRTPAYKQFGNSVAVPVIKKIAHEIIRKIK